MNRNPLVVPGIHATLGVRPFINADSLKTALGGSLMPPPVIAAMQEAASAFVDMHELQEAVSARIADLTRNEAAHVAAGAGAGLVLSALACMTGSDQRLIGRALANGPQSHSRREFIVQCGQRNPYDPALQLAGGQLVQVGNVLQTFPWEVEAAISERTAAVLFFAGEHLGFGSLRVEEIIRIAHAANVPVIVDAAAQLPPKENLWRFSELGADLVVFSGGKELRGPQASGLIVGRRELVAACRLHASPYQRLARAMKVGKEEMIGLLAAIELYVEQDEAAELDRCEAIVRAWVAGFEPVAGLTAKREFPGTDGRPLPRAIMEIEPASGVSGDEMRDAMLEGEPRVVVAVKGPTSFHLNPELLERGEEHLVLNAVVAAFERCASRRSRRASNA